MLALFDVTADPEYSPMNVLIVESRSDLGTLWQRHLERQNMAVTLVRTEAEAIDHLTDTRVDILILDLVLEDGKALAIADFAEFRQPHARVIFVSNTSFFSDGSIFAHAANAQALIPSDTAPEDLAAMVEHYGAQSRPA